MAKLGASVYMVDLTDQLANIENFNTQIGRKAITFRQLDVRELKFANVEQRFDVIYSQRMLSCIRYAEARELISKILEVSSTDAHYFVSAGGLNTEIGRQNPHRRMPVEQRWAIASAEVSAKHQVAAPECPYTVEELVQLLESCALAVVRSWTSEFGNPKVICKRTAV
jgi:2-polyprenyl-3-methyl-5-hydroxy-6-metoxy-1,4-benzoquinol methylase